MIKDTNARNVGRRMFLVVPSIACTCVLLLQMEGSSNSQTAAPAVKWSESGTGPVRKVVNTGGATLGYSIASGVKILTASGYAFKDLNKNGKLDRYEDWRLPAEERAKDLASKMTVDQIAGLMLYSGHQAIPNTGGAGGAAGTYGGKPFAQSGAKSSDLTDQQREFLTRDNLRHVLITSVESPETAARWNNNLQALVEGLGLGIPANTSSDPRHGSDSSKEYNAGAGGRISMWPESLGLAATFDPEITRRFGGIAAKEYRALGISTALSPQVDLATDPRWSRFNGTFGENSRLAADMARAYVDGFQTSTGDREISGGWGYESVNAMVKHWPGGGTGEAGRDAHFVYGKFAVYPGNNFDEHLIPFVEGAFKLPGKTKMASAVMPYYTISYNQDVRNKENVGNSYSSYFINDLLRTKYRFDGVVCTDWGITADDGPKVETFAGRPFGVEDKTVAQRHYKVIMAGVDQFGGNNAAGPIIEAYDIGIKERGVTAMRKRFEQSAVRLLKNIFRVGLFENPYLDIQETAATVGKPAYMAAGYDAQLKSIVMLKNKAHVLPLTRNKVVYIPKKYTPAGLDWIGRPTPEVRAYPVNLEIVKKYFQVTDDPESADYALCFISTPNSGPGYSGADRQAGGNGYLPMSLQYRPYTAVYAREHSIAAGDPLEGGRLDRSYKGKTVTTLNNSDLDMVLNAKAAMKGKPVIVSIRMSKPTVVAEFEKEAAAITVTFGVQDQAVLDVLTGSVEPFGLLPFQLPADMRTVEQQREDVAMDMDCHVDSEGSTYDFAFGLNWKGVINDLRTSKYRSRRVM